VRALADALLRKQSGDAAAAAAYETRATALLARIDVPSLGSCAALAARASRCVQQRNWGECFRDFQGEPLRRALRLTPVQDCMRDMAASVDDPYILHGFMMLFANIGVPDAQLARAMLPPPAGGAARVKSAHALALAHEAFRILAAYPNGEVPHAQAERIRQLLATPPNDAAAAAAARSMRVSWLLRRGLLHRAGKLAALALLCYVVMRLFEWLERQRQWRARRAAARRHRPPAAAARSRAD
jgi:hypothetical protein